MAPPLGGLLKQELPRGEPRSVLQANSLPLTRQ